MIEAKNIKLDNEIVSLEYKSDLDDKFQKLIFNIKDFKIIETSIKENTQVRNYMLYSHLMKPIVKLIEEGKLKDTFQNTWY